MRKRIILAARYYSIEPLGIHYLAGVIRDAGWECKVVLVREFDFEPLYRAVQDYRPDLVGFQIWTGYHTQAFQACDAVRAMGVPVVIGGPHATYFDAQCLAHADWVIKGGAFGLIGRLLKGELPAGVHFTKEGRKDPFPQPDRAVVYEAYPELGMSPIKSIFASVGCPFFCTYCYAPSFNQMHGGFDLTVRPVDEIVAEARDAAARWPTKLFYFQDDIFGYNVRWLEEFAEKWPRKVGVPFHCQIRLELTEHDKGAKRLDLFQKAGCTGITLAIESGNAFLRDHVMFRHMDDDLILAGCKKIMDRGMTLRTEQILAVPFSDIDTDLLTLRLNGEIDPTMVWTSVLAPYDGTDIATIAKNFGFYTGNNDDLAESFFDRSVLRHVEGGPRDISTIVKQMGAGPKSRTLLKLQANAMGRGGPRSGWVGDVCPVGSKATIGIIHFLSKEENDLYCEQTVRLQRLFFWLAKVPSPAILGRRLVDIADDKWTWNHIGEVATRHISARGGRVQEWAATLAAEMGLAQLPAPVSANPSYFAHMPAGGVLAARCMEQNVFGVEKTTQETLDALSTLTRRHLFHYGLYKIESGREPIATK